MQLSSQCRRHLPRPTLRSAASGAAARVANSVRCRAQAVHGRFGGGRGGSVLDRPELELNRDYGYNADKDSNVLTAPPPETDKDSGNTNRDRNTPAGGGNYRLLLIDAPSHTEQRVVKAITTVVPGVDEGHAKNCFNTSRTLGVAIITSTLKEHAEFYSEQLYRWSCKTRIEPDSTVA